MWLIDCWFAIGLAGLGLGNGFKVNDPLCNSMFHIMYSIQEGSRK